VQNGTRAEIIKYTYSKYLPSYKNCWYSIYWGSGTTWLVWWNSSWIESQSVRRIMFKTVLIIYLEYAKKFHLFLLFYRAFFTSKNTCKISRKISYNWNPVNSIDIYISSNMFVLNGPISMEVRFNTFPILMMMWIVFHSILKNSGYCAPLRRIKKNRFEWDLAQRIINLEASFFFLQYCKDIHLFYLLTPRVFH
jgi:hypothetical protein